MPKNYLFIADWSQNFSETENCLADKVIAEFWRAAFMTDSTLFILLEDNRISLLKFWAHRMKLCRPQLQFVFKNQTSLPDLMKNIDCLITGKNLETDALYADFAWKNNIEIVSANIQGGGGFIITFLLLRKLFS